MTDIGMTAVGLALSGGSGSGRKGMVGLTSSAGPKSPGTTLGNRTGCRPGENQGDNPDISEPHPETSLPRRRNRLAHFVFADAAAELVAGVAFTYRVHSLVVLAGIRLIPSRALMAACP